jgi:[ribosomal protein S5]-alanine N-acetyltransferase
MPPPETITAPLVVLRRIRPADALSLFQIISNPEVMRFMDWPMPTDPNSTAAHLQDATADWELGSEYQWVVLERQTGDLVGSISFRPNGHAADFGYFFGRSYWGRGLALEAASTVVNWLAGQSKIYRIWASVDTDNSRSIRLLERLGLRLEGVLRKATIRPNIGGPPRDTAIYARVKDGA